MDTLIAKDFSVECTNYPVKFYVEEWLQRRGHQIRKGGWKIKAEMRGEELDLFCYDPGGREVGSAHSGTLMLEAVRAALVELSRAEDGREAVF